MAALCACFERVDAFDLFVKRFAKLTLTGTNLRLAGPPAPNPHLHHHRAHMPGYLMGGQVDTGANRLPLLPGSDRPATPLRFAAYIHRQRAARGKARS